MSGASAGVMSVLFFLSAYDPQYRIRIIFFDIKILYITLFIFFYDIIQIPLNNSGGHIAHVGGALWGYLYAMSIYKNSFNIDLKEIINKLKFSNLNKSENQKMIDSILDKISESGYESLTKKEKELLFKSKDQL